jgi:hypothetical protein
MEGGQRPLGAVLLDVAEGRVEEHDDPDHGCVLHLAEGAGQRGRTQQDQDEQIGELVEEAPPGGPWRLLAQAVGAMGQQTGCRIGAVQAAGRVTAECPGSIAGVEGVPRVGGARGVHGGRSGLCGA